MESGHLCFSSQLLLGSTEVVTSALLFLLEDFALLNESLRKTG